ncbi:MAG: hypothetical protein GY719_41325 [bacterium]|nr:hypothetical protein [bacterium]
MLDQNSLSARPTKPAGPHGSDPRRPEDEKLILGIAQSFELLAKTFYATMHDQTNLPQSFRSRTGSRLSRKRLAAALEKNNKELRALLDTRS